MKGKGIVIFGLILLLLVGSVAAYCIDDDMDADNYRGTFVEKIAGTVTCYNTETEANHSWEDVCTGDENIREYYADEKFCEENFRSDCESTGYNIQGETKTVYYYTKECELGCAQMAYGPDFCMDESIALEYEGNTYSQDDVESNMFHEGEFCSTCRGCLDWGGDDRCKDEDGGYDRYEPGMTYAAAGDCDLYSFKDTCNGALEIKEYYCYNDDPATGTAAVGNTWARSYFGECTFGCVYNANGADYCVGDVQWGEEDSYDFSCKDPDIDYESEGIYALTSVTYQTQEFEDYCIDSTQLAEMKCSNGPPNQETVECDFGCLDGICYGGTCDDPDALEEDGGIYVASSTHLENPDTGESYDVDDFCYDSNTLTEGICAGLGLDWIECEGGCYDTEDGGVCIRTDGVVQAGVPECINNVDDDDDGLVDGDDSGCQRDQDNFEYSACFDGWDNDNDTTRDFYGGCAEDNKGFTTHYCGCDYDNDQELETSNIVGVNEFNHNQLTCETLGYTYGCIEADMLFEEDQGFDPDYNCSGGTVYRPEEGCESATDGSEKDGYQNGQGDSIVSMNKKTTMGFLGFTIVNVPETKEINAFKILQGAFLQIPSGVGLLITLF